MTDIPETYDPERIESEWQEYWLEESVYAYEDTGATDYVIDTPPPYPTGNLHIGNALGWCYMDFLARYRRMQGDDVLFPQGWDCHGLPTEVKVEENQDIHRTEVPREDFREMCVDHTETQIDAMRTQMRQLGFSQDWNQEFRTMDPSYWGKTQRSFVEMAAEDYVYRDEHPVNWCPRCQTAIADAEVENEDRDGTLYYITFPGIDTDEIEIATTRPELLAATGAVAVHPDDDRYDGRVGDTFEVPPVGQEVELIADEEVDPEFGTGAVMISTFGDKQDVDWWAEYDLDLRAVLTEDGHLNELAGEYEGLSIEAAKKAIPADLDEAGLLVDSEPVEQSVGVCWRCDTPIEILSKDQWFVEVRQDEILEKAQEVDWVPEHMYARLEEWTEGMSWDWVISRQRVFATPIPAWQCESCGHWEIADLEELPVEPTDTGPTIDACPECTESEWAGETDVMDTWMDSSISAMHVAGWPEMDFEPVALREQGHDIIRTWAFYTLLRTAALEDEKPWDTALINGMVFGPDGNKMSKSRGNVVSPDEVLDEESADAFRQAMAVGGQPGADVQFQWKEVTAASRFLTKLWNIVRFASGHFDEDTPEISAPAYRDTDRWILDRLATVTEETAAAMDENRFDQAVRTIREFVWDDLADDYLELVKGRLYNGRPGERDAARSALYDVLSATVQLIAPFSPFIAEEIWHHLPGTDGSVHQTDWPAIETPDGDTTGGKVIAEAARSVRAWKSDQGIALNEALERVELYFDDEPQQGVDTYDLSETVAAPIRTSIGRPDLEEVATGVDPDDAKIGPEFRNEAGAVMAALEAADPDEIKAQLDSGGSVEVPVDGSTVELDPEMVDVPTAFRTEAGEEVAVLEASFGTIVVVP
ncbi:MAG: valine--tRNA ligase [Halodesulfurarchaeum sp.]|nr:valine--tRNA ligase [Halodesulfurarchaeum sp.]